MLTTINRFTIFSGICYINPSERALTFFIFNCIIIVSLEIKYIDKFMIKLIESILNKLDLKYNQSINQSSINLVTTRKLKI